MRRWALRIIQGALVMLVAAPALAHDTWFEARAGKPGELVMALGTGNRFPLQEYAIGVEHLQHIGCRQGADRVPLAVLANSPTALLLRATPTGPEPLSCWAQLKPMTIELPPDKIGIYLDEINPPAAVREAWSRMQSRGLVWKERYTKHARIGFAGGAPGVAMGMDVRVESGPQPPHAGDPLVFQVLRDGAPLADFAVELCSDQDPRGQWLKTDAQGQVRIEAPQPGRWILRGTDLRLSTTRLGTWESRFVTLAFEVLAAP